MDLVVVLRRRGLGGDVVDVVDVGGGVALLDGAGALGRGLGLVRVVSLVDLLILGSPLRRCWSLMTLMTP